jgi:uncharacterized protein YcgI (DUF1989 family)
MTASETVEDWYGGLAWPPASLHPRPLKRSFYEAVRATAASASLQTTSEIPANEGLALDLEAGRVVTVRLNDGPQIVNLWTFNTHDPDERLWVQDMCLTEGLYLTRLSRLWGEMARYRPLLTVIEDTVSPRRGVGDPTAPHHFLFGGAGTPSIWRLGGGHPGVKTTWEQFVSLASGYGIPSHRLTDNVCLFQKTAIQSRTQRFVILPSDAMAGDVISLFAEIDVTVFLVLSPYVDGARTPSELVGVGPRRVTAEVSEVVAQPLGWPYVGMPYPELQYYLGKDGARDPQPGPTPHAAYHGSPS